MLLKADQDKLEKVRKTTIIAHSSKIYQTDRTYFLFLFEINISQFISSQFLIYLGDLKCTFSQLCSQLYFISSDDLIETVLSNKHYFNPTEMGNKRNRRSRRGQSPSLERDLSASEAEALQSNETMIESLSNFDVSSVRGR